MADKGEEKKKGSKSRGSDSRQDAGYETDGTASKSRTRLRKKSKQHLADDGYTTDGYVSSSNPSLRKVKSKSRFFKLGNRSKPSLDDEGVRIPVEPPSPVPAPAFRLPIAARFATTLNLDTENAVLEPPTGLLGTSRAPTPVSTFTPLSVSVFTSRYNEEQDSFSGPLKLALSSSDPSFDKRIVTRFPISGSNDNDGIDSHNVPSLLSTPTSTNSTPATEPVRSPASSKPNISYPLTLSPSPTSPPISAPLESSNSKGSLKPLFLKFAPSDLKNVGSDHDSSAGWSPAGTPGRSASPAGFPTDLVVPSPSQDILVLPNNLSRYDLPPPTPPPTAPLPDVPTEPERMRPEKDSGRQKEIEQSERSLLEPSGRPSSPQQRGRVSPFPVRPVHGASGRLASRFTHAKFGVGPSRGFESQVKVERYRDLYGIPPPPPVGGWQTNSNNGDSNKKDSGYASSPETSTFNFHNEGSRNHRRQSRQSRQHRRKNAKVGINVEHPSDDGEDEGDMKRMMRDYAMGNGRSASALGYQQELTAAAALEQRKSLEVPKNYYYENDHSNSKARSKKHSSLSPSASTSEDELSDESRYTSDGRSMYKIPNKSQGRSLGVRWADDNPSGNAWYDDDNDDNEHGDEGIERQSRASFMDAEKSDAAREQFVRRIEAFFDRNGRELSPSGNVRIGRNEVVPPVPRIPQRLHVHHASSKV
ncbi:hypothetical protein D9757_006626 [Collybiopsis confluens]|uniref:Uncharacterized protein n=1 Tax=Collybiopsis confluens TaxID=2823264 RepID=A0A8H5HN84_9AGAR|nr:hypothetical protein D9757_006626 [Collybiopsis confluens]